LSLSATGFYGREVALGSKKASPTPRLHKGGFSIGNLARAAEEDGEIRQKKGKGVGSGGSRGP